MTSRSKPAGYTSVSPYLVVDDAQRVVEFLKQEPRHREGDPDRRGGVKDPVGNTW
jgi:hypothetical protein